MELVGAQRLRRGVFTSLTDLTEAITVWAEHWNSDPKSFVWKATAQQIIKKVREALSRLIVPAPAALSPAERAALWRESIKGLPPTPPLSDEAISRESIYDSRG